MVESTVNKDEIVVVPDKEVDPSKLININIGVLGHIDSGKTSLCKALSTISSTASMDKSPQSKERGITLDLGFSAFVVGVPNWLREKEPEKLANIDFIQFTLVDCPGHASLMKTVIGGASIIDMMVLVVDVQKLIQTQTFECIVLGEILMDKLIIACNKVDLLKDDPEKLKAQIKTLKQTIGKTQFGPTTEVVPVSAANASAEETRAQSGVQELITKIMEQIEIPDRNAGAQKDFLFAIDHCFQIKGQGTVVTGTVLAGQAKIGDTIEIPAMKVDKKIKSMQMFRKAVKSIKQGDRAAMCLPQLDATKIERGIAAKPRTVQYSDLAIMIVRRVPYYPSDVKNKAQFHISLGHQTAIGTVTFFSCETTDGDMTAKFNKNSLKAIDQKLSFDIKKEYRAEDLLPKQRRQKKVVEESKGESKDPQQDAPRTYYAIIKFNKEILAQEQTLLIGSKLDAETSMKQCRLSFYGQVLQLFRANQDEKEREVALQQIQIMKTKKKIGKIDKVIDASNIHVKDLFSKETAPEIFVNLVVTLTETGQKGRIIGTFGKSGKLKVKLETPLDPDTDFKSLVGNQVELNYKKNMMKKQGNKFKAGIIE